MIAAGDVAGAAVSGAAPVSAGAGGSLPPQAAAAAAVPAPSRASSSRRLNCRSLSIDIFIPLGAAPQTPGGR